jgi:hypothetical protein
MHMLISYCAMRIVAADEQQKNVNAAESDSIIRKSKSNSYLENISQ